MSVLRQQLRCETGESVDFITCRTQLSRLWFVNNNELALAILSYLAKYYQFFGVTLYAFVIMGNHYHLIAQFPLKNRAGFMRAFNSIIQKLVKRHVKEFEGGTLWGRRYSAEVLPNKEDVSHYALYAWLNCVISGLALRLSDYASYNSFSDSARRIKRIFRVVDWTGYNNRKRHNSKLSIKDCTKEYTLEFARLPGCETMTDRDYCQHLHCLLEKRRIKEVTKRQEEGKGFAGVEELKRTRPGDKPQTTKTSSRESRRPVVLTLCAITRKAFLEWYFGVVAAYKEASRRYRAGDYGVEFPPGTYKPPLFSVA